MEVIKFEVQDVATAIGVLATSLKRELFLLDKSILDTKEKLRDFEEKSGGGMRSEDFFARFNEGLAGDDQATMLWVAEFEALKLLERACCYSENAASMQVKDYFAEIQNLLWRSAFVENVDVEHEAKSKTVGLIWFCHGVSPTYL